MTTLPRDRISLAALTLVAAAGAAWFGLAAWEPPMGLVGFLLGWALMMTAMMLPSIVPLALLYRGSREPAVQKVLRLGERVAWATGVGLLAVALVTAIG